MATTKAVTVDMEYDAEARVFVTHVKQLHQMSSFGETEISALENTAEMIRGYIKGMQDNGKTIPLPASKLKELKRIVGLS